MAWRKIRVCISVDVSFFTCAQEFVAQQGVPALVLLLDSPVSATQVAGCLACEALAAHPDAQEALVQAIPRMLSLAKAITPAQEPAAAALAKVVGLEALATSQVVAAQSWLTIMRRLPPSSLLTGAESSGDGGAAGAARGQGQGHGLQARRAQRRCDRLLRADGGARRRSLTHAGGRADEAS